jgi:hypothetical protein
MLYLTRLWANIKASPKTSAGAFAGTIGSVVTAVKNPAVLSSEAWWTVLLVSLGLLFASDVNKEVTVNHSSVQFTRTDLERLEELTKERK